jgi:hypothetical protein
MTDTAIAELTLASDIPQQWNGGAGIIMVNGTIGGATVDLYISDDATNWIAVGSQLTDVGIQVFAGPRNSWLKAVVAGGSPVLTIKVYREAGLNAWVVNPAGASGGGGVGSDVTIAGISYKGQKTSANSFPVVLASDYSISTSSLDMVAISGTIGSAAVLSNFPKTDCTGLQGLSIQFTTVTAGNSAVVEESTDGTTWTTVNSIKGAASVTAVGIHQYNISAKQVRVRCSVFSSGTVAATAEFRAQPFNQPIAYGAGAVDTTTQRVCLASDSAMPLPSGAATSAKQDTIITALGSPFQAGASIGNASFGISGTLPAFAATPTVNLGTLNGAATAVKQPALGTAGSASADVITVQGVSSMTPILATCSAGTNLNTSLLALESGGNLATIAGAVTSSKMQSNVAQINGVTPLMGAGNTGTGSPRCTIATDQVAIALWGHGVLAATLPANATAVGMRTLAATPSDTTAHMNSPVLDVKGSQVVQPYGLGDNSVSGLTAAMTGTTSTAVTGMGAPGANLYNYITSIVIGNSHATVDTFVELQDGSGGTTFFTLPAKCVYGGVALTFPKPLKQPTANTALYAKNSTTGANTIVSVCGYKGP